MNLSWHAVVLAVSLVLLLHYVLRAVEQSSLRRLDVLLALLEMVLAVSATIYFMASLDTLLGPHSAKALDAEELTTLLLMFKFLGLAVLLWISTAIMRWAARTIVRGLSRSRIGRGRTEVERDEVPACNGPESTSGRTNGQTATPDTETVELQTADAGSHWHVGSVVNWIPDALAILSIPWLVRYPAFIPVATAMSLVAYTVYEPTRAFDHLCSEYFFPHSQR
jgi:hypothetical protein